jgi:hypothetical protein
MKTGDDVVLKKGYNVSINFGDIEFCIAEGTNGVVLEVESVTLGDSIHPAQSCVGFKITDTIVVKALIDINALEVI